MAESFPQTVGADVVDVERVRTFVESAGSTLLKYRCLHCLGCLPLSILAITVQLAFPCSFTACFTVFRV